MGHTVAELVGPHAIAKTCMYTENTYIDDGFSEGFRSKAMEFGFKFSQVSYLY